jgi:ABC-2 type transport system permease protein
MGSIVGRGDLIRKVKISKPAIVVASILSAGVNFGLNLIVVAFFMLVTHAQIQPLAIVLFPLLILELVAIIAGAAFFLSALYVRFRDIAPIWDVFLQIMFYATPIIYPLSLVNSHKKIQFLIALNPLAQVIQDARRLLVTPVTLTTHQVLPLWLSYALPLVFAVIVARTSILFFRKSAKSFAENL